MITPIDKIHNKNNTHNTDIGDLNDPFVKEVLNEMQNDFISKTPSNANLGAPLESIGLQQNYENQNVYHNYNQDYNYINIEVIKISIFLTIICFIILNLLSMEYIYNIVKSDLVYQYEVYIRFGLIFIFFYIIIYKLFINTINKWQ